MTAYYNEIDPFAAAWLRELIKAGHIAPGEVYERSIEDVKPSDLAGFTQCHFFAGIGVWSYALRKAGWDDQRPVWTGSCPCQPFSTAGKRTGTADERHLWPAMEWLVRQSKPPVIFGEQVGSKDGLTWLDAVSADLESQGYTVGAADICAAGFGAPHIRQRLYFVANSQQHKCGQVCKNASRCGKGSGQEGLEQRSSYDSESEQVGLSRRSRQPRESSGLENPGHESERGLPIEVGACVPADREGSRPTSERPGGSFWSECDWIPCVDGKSRPVEPGTFPLAHGATARVGRLRGYGNAIVAPVATAFIEAFLETERGQ